VLAVYHEVQYLYFAYAMARHSESFCDPKGLEGAMAPARANADTPLQMKTELRREARHTVSFLRWPVIGFVGAVVGGWIELAWLAPLGIGGLFCHYWLDSRIWTGRSRSV
jgi:hypothetical protein